MLSKLVKTTSKQININFGKVDIFNAFSLKETGIRCTLITVIAIQVLTFFIIYNCKHVDFPFEKVNSEQ